MKQKTLTIFVVALFLVGVIMPVIGISTGNVKVEIKARKFVGGRATVPVLTDKGMQFSFLAKSKPRGRKQKTDCNNYKPCRRLNCLWNGNNNSDGERQGG